MSWNRLDARVRDVAVCELTDLQLQVLKLHLAGLGYRRISVMLTPARDPKTIRGHLDAAHRTLAQHGIHRRDDGTYYLQENQAA